MFEDPRLLPKLKSFPSVRVVLENVRCFGMFRLLFTALALYSLVKEQPKVTLFANIRESKFQMVHITNQALVVD